jgi:hypothetical protein
VGKNYKTVVEQMLSKLVVVDYSEGAGGEFISYFVSCHSEFLNLDVDTTDMQSIDGALLKYLNSQSIVDPDWNQNFKQQFLHFADKCAAHGISNIAVPYHLYKFPEHVDTIKSCLPGTRFIKINHSASRHQTIVLDFFKKVWFKKLSASNLVEIKYLTQNFSLEHKKAVIRRMQQNKLMYLDLALIKKNIPVNSSTRQTAINNFQMLPQKVCPSTDIVIEYDDFFIDFERTPGAYKQLCDQLEILPSADKLDKLIHRNKKNYNDLKKFATNFNHYLKEL